MARGVTAYGEKVMPMVAYRTAWFSVALLFGAVGVWASLATSTGGSVSLFCFVVLAVASVALTVMDQHRRSRWRLAFVIGGTCGGSVVAAMGLADLLGPGVAFSLVVVLAVSSPQMVARVLRRDMRSDDAAGPVGGELPPSDRRSNVMMGVGLTASGAPAGSTSAPESGIMSAGWMVRAPESMDEASLCLAWRRTYVALQHVRTQRATLGVVQRRQELLDELERRNARGFAAWLASGARAAGNPSKYVFPAARAGHHYNNQ